MVADAVIRAADGARREVWRVAVRTRLGRRCAQDRSVRLCTLALGHLAVGLVLTGAAPLWMLLLGPLVLGVPHVVADIRYLLVRPPPGARRAMVPAILVPLAALTALRVATTAGLGSWPLLEVAFGGAAVLGGALTARGAAWARGLVLALATVGLAWAFSRPGLAALVLAHLHNLVGFGLWMALALREGRRGTLLLVGLAYAACALFILLGGLDALTAGDATATVGGLTLSGMVATLAPGVPGVLATRLVLLFAFAQAIHYVVWVRLMPGTAPWATRPSTPTVRRAAQDLSADLGRWGLRLAVGATVLVLVLGALEPAGTHVTYLSLVLFHGWLELAVVAHLLAQRR